MTDVPIFLINLDRSTERLEFMTNQAISLGLSFERIGAVEGRQVPDWLADDFRDASQMSDGQVGCYASHLCVAQTIVGRCLSQAIVLEDDACLSPDFRHVSRAAIEHAPPGWDYIHISSRFKKTVIKVADLGHHALVRYVQNPSGTVAYILSNRGARKWLEPMPRIRPNDLDNRFAWQQRLNVYGVYPALVGHRDDTDSTLQRRRGRPHWEPPLIDRFHGEIWHACNIGVFNYAAGSAMNLVNSFRKRIDGKIHVAVL